jgi:hypothetical protein
MQAHPSRKGHAMTAYVQNLLSSLANKFSFDAYPVLASVVRTALTRARHVGAYATLIRRQTQRMLKRYLAYGNIALAGLWAAALALPELPRRAPREVPRAIEPALQTVGDHWQRAMQIVAAAQAGFKRVQRLQAEAGRQLDAADYALSQLLADLRPAMALPTDVSGLRAILAEAERTAPERQRKALAA